MRVPKRTAAYTSDEIVSLYAHLYPNGVHAIAVDQAYGQARRKGVEQCHVWINRGACPHAVESTMALVEAQQLDEQLSASTSRSSSVSWSVRATYAMAITRFVNALADEMQRGLYAQSIFGIAEQIGLPTWFVELRHAATHEDLPSMDVLRHASVEALAWLQRKFWLPNVQKARLLNSSSNSSSNSNSNNTDTAMIGMTGETNDNDERLAAAEQQISNVTAEELRTHLATYRRLAKQVARDASLRGPSRSALIATQARIVSCVRRANAKYIEQHRRLDANAAKERGQHDPYDDALDILTAVLVEPGHLIPLAKQKRLFVAQNQHSVAPMSSVLAQTWTPLLEYIADAEDPFLGALLDSLLDNITNVAHADNQEQDADKHSSAGENEKGIADTAASWIIYLFAQEGTMYARMTKRARREQDEGQALLSLVHRCLSNPTRQSIAVARHICASDANLQQRVGHLIDLAAQTKSDQVGNKLGQDTLAFTIDGGETRGDAATESDSTLMSEMEKNIMAMEQQLVTLQQQKKQSLASLAEQKDNRTGSVHGIVVPAKEDDEKRQKAVCALLDGWSVLSSENDAWQATPIGCLNGRVPRLELSPSLWERT